MLVGITISKAENGFTVRLYHSNSCPGERVFVYNSFEAVMGFLTMFDGISEWRESGPPQMDE